MDEGYLSRIIDGFVKKGFILKKKSKEDGRVYLLTLSVKGQAVVLKVDGLSDKHIADMIKGLGKEELTEMMDLIERFQAILLKTSTMEHIDEIERVPQFN